MIYRVTIRANVDKRMNDRAYRKGNVLFRWGCAWGIVMCKNNSESRDLAEL